MNWCYCFKTCHDVLVEVKVSRFCCEILTLVATKMASQKTIVDLTEILDLLLTVSFMKYLLKLTGNS